MSSEENILEFDDVVREEKKDGKEKGFICYRKICVRGWWGRGLGVCLKDTFSREQVQDMW